MTVTSLLFDLLSDGPIFGKPLAHEVRTINILAAKVSRKISFSKDTPEENPLREKHVS